MKDKPIAHLEAKGNELLVCYGEDQREGCLGVDVETRAVSSAQPPPPVEESAPRIDPAPYTVETTSSTIKVCKSGTSDCATVKPGYKTPNVIEKKELVAGGSARLAQYGFVVKDVNPGGRKDARLVLYYDRIPSLFGLKTWLPDVVQRVFRLRRSSQRIVS